MNYITYFKETGHRITTIIPGIHFTEDNKETALNDYLQEFNASYYAELTEDEHNLLLNGDNIYIDGTIKPALAELKELTAEEQERINKREYERQLQQYKELLASALLMGDNDTLKSLQEEYKEFQEYYNNLTGATKEDLTESEEMEETEEYINDESEENNIIDPDDLEEVEEIEAPQKEEKEKQGETIKEEIKPPTEEPQEDTETESNEVEDNINDESTEVETEATAEIEGTEKGAK